MAVSQYQLLLFLFIIFFFIKFIQKGSCFSLVHCFFIFLLFLLVLEKLSLFTIVTIFFLLIILHISRITIKIETLYRSVSCALLSAEAILVQLQRYTHTSHHDHHHQHHQHHKVVLVRIINVFLLAQSALPGTSITQFLLQKAICVKYV